MRINVTQTITGYEGEELKEGEKAITYRAVFYQALNAQLPDETLTAEQKAQIYQLTTKLFKSNDVNIGVTEAALIKERVGKAYGPLIYGRVCDLLDPPTDANSETPPQS